MFSQRTNWNLAPNRFTRAVEEHRRSGREALDLTVSNPTAVGFQYESGLLRALSNPAALSYMPDAKGMRSAREAVSAYYAARGERVPPENIILTTSTSEAYTFAFRLLCDPGDEVLIPVPGYPLFEFLATIEDVQLKPYGLFYDDGWHLDAHSLRTGLNDRTRAIMAVHPNNPTGSYVSAADAGQLNEIASQRGLALVIDEVFLDFAHEAQARPSFATNAAVLTFTLSGLSKIAGLPQMKFAWVAVSGPTQVVRTALERLEVIADTYLSMNAPVQLAAPAMLAARESFQGQLMSRVRENLAAMDAQLARQSLCNRLDIEAGWYAVLRVPVSRSDEELAIELLQNCGVLVHPGHFYEFPGDGYLVLSLIAPEGDFREGTSRLLNFF